MIHKCLYSDTGKCKYGGEVDTDLHAYSMKSVDGEDIYWHYLCYLGSQPEVIYLSHDSYKELLEWIREAFKDVEKPQFVQELLKDDQPSD